MNPAAPAETGTPDSLPALEVEGVVKAYGPRRALDGLSFSIAPGEYVSLLGPNGAGKTTLFQLLAGLFVPDAGTVRINGHDMSVNAVTALESLGVVFQQATLDLDLTVRDNLAFHGRLHGLSGKEIRERSAKELKMVDLEDRAQDRTRALSGGQRRRVELARSLLHQPHILLMDEPTVGLDPPSRRDLLDYVLELRRERSVAVLWATHLVDEAEHADRVIVLHRGTIRRDGTPDALLEAAGTRDLHDALIRFTVGTKAETSP